ncbi:RNA-directed DNA polymerase [Pedobacter antarcticus]|uniref:RNA-directed DNA polymerase n=2 Tax=Pedobacter antarcticus TaxID=34086 RepID=A0A1I2FNR1_9SPHI|nr:RNA-directed DNA polymerase [Pedobacter antarcticus]
MLLEQIISKSNVRQAYERVVANKGAAGVDGIGFLDFTSDVRVKWPLIKIQLGKGEYRPMAVKRVKIPKANGGVRLYP